MTILSKSRTLIAGLAASLLGGGTPAAASAGPTVTFSGDLPTLHSEFAAWDVCQEVDDLIEQLGFIAAYLPRLCDYEMTQSFAIAAASVSITGTLDSLVVHDGQVHVDGAIAGEVELTPLIVAGGRAPVFAPCDRGAFAGCFLPDAEMLTGLLAAVDRAPALDIELPMPNRMCVPGLPVVVTPGRLIPGSWRAGYWAGGTWHAPRWKPARVILPEFETCRVTDWGELPTVSLPQVERATLDAYPHVAADLSLSISGDGAIEVEVPIPYSGVTAGYANQWVDLKVAAGASLVVTLEVEDAGADAHLVFDQDLHVRMVYERGVGWTQQVSVIRNESSPSITPHGAAVTLRAALRLGLEANAMAGIGDDDDDDDDTAADDTADDSSAASDEAATGDDATADDATDNDANDDDATDDDDAVALPPLPVPDEVQCAADWMLGGAALEIGLEANAALELFVEGTYPLFSATDDVAFQIDTGLELSHAEAISVPGMCEIGCEAIAGTDNPACDPIEVFRAPVATIASPSTN
jgi:hypothetical protein